MIRRVKEKNYRYKHALGTIVTEAVIGVSDKGRRSLSAAETKRLTKLAAVAFLNNNYIRSIEDTDFTLSAREVRAIMSFIGIDNQEKFGKLIGCSKSKMSKILNSNQPISKPQAQLAIERLAMELVMPGSTKRLLRESEIKLTIDPTMQTTVDSVRYGT